MKQSLRVHRCSVFPEDPSAVQTLRYDPDSARLAVARADGAEQRGIEV